MERPDADGDLQAQIWTINGWASFCWQRHLLAHAHKMHRDDHARTRVLVSFEYERDCAIAECTFGDARLVVRHDDRFALLFDRFQFQIVELLVAAVENHLAQVDLQELQQLFV